MAETAEQAADRCSFQLTYGRSPTIRRFEPGWLSGPPTPNAHHQPGDPHDTQPGEWYSDTDVDSDDPDDHIDHYASLAIGEAVHEALEWFQVDGAPWLDPHGDAQAEIYAAVDTLCTELAKIRRGE